MDPINLANGKFKNVTVNLGAKVKGVVVEDANVVFENDVAGQVVWEKKGNDIIITAYDAPGGVVNPKKILGKVTIKNVGTKNIVEGIGGDYEATIAGANLAAFDFINTPQGFYELGDSNSTKAQKLTGTYLNEGFYGGKGADTLKAVGGDNVLEGGKGADKMYAGVGHDDFIIAKGDALLDAKGKGGDIIYGADNYDRLTFAASGDLKLSKENNNLVIEDAHDEGIDKITVDNYFYALADDRIALNGINIAAETMNIKGDAKKANVLLGTAYNDSITGGNKDDFISTGTGNDTINGGLGDEEILIDGNGQKTIFIHKGEGDDSIYVYEDFVTKEGSDINVVFDEDETSQYFYSKTANNITVISAHMDGPVASDTESVEILNYFDPETGKPNTDATAVGNIKVNGTALNTQLADATIEVEGVSIGTILAETGGAENASAAMKKANLYLGSGYNDNFEGSVNKEIMMSFDGINTFKTGTKGQTLIASYGVDHPTLSGTEIVHTAGDTYNVESFESGTVIYDQDGQYNMTIKGVNADDIHMASINHLFDFGIENFPAVSGVEYLTDTKGLTNIEGINCRKLYPNFQPFSDVENRAKLFNYIIDPANGLVDKFRGVALSTHADAGHVLKDINIIDKKGDAQTISALSQQVVEANTQDNVVNYMSAISWKFLINVDSLTSLGKLLVDPTHESFWVSGQDIIDAYGEEQTSVVPSSIMKYYKVAEKGATMAETTYALSDTAFKEIKSDLFTIFKNSYVGTSGDNTYTINKSTYGAAIASGTGSDTFVFNGDVGTEEWTGYTIASTLNADDKDTIEFKKYSFDDNTVRVNEIIGVDNDKVILDGLDFSLINNKSLTRAQVDYSLTENNNGLDITNSKFDGLTIKDSKRAYEFTAEHSDEAIAYNWSENEDQAKTNHYAIVNGENVTITSNGAYNRISKYGEGSFNYTYADGNDIVISDWEASDDTYNVALTMTGKKQDAFTANLSIEDWGEEDNDTLVIANEDVSNLRLYFNVDSGNNVENQITIMSKADLAKGKSAFNIVDYGWGQEAVAKNGIDFNYNLYGNWSGIEQVTYDGGEENLNVDAIITSVKAEIAGWQGWEKGYEDVNDVLTTGKAADIKEVLAMYDNAYDTVMNQPA